MKNFFNFFVLSRVIAIIILVGALSRHAYSYYNITRLVVCGVCIYSANLSYTLKKEKWLYIFIIIAIIFNPFIPIHLVRKTWKIIDVFSAIVLFISLFQINTRIKNGSNLFKR